MSYPVTSTNWTVPWKSSLQELLWCHGARDGVVEPSLAAEQAKMLKDGSSWLKGRKKHELEQMYSFWGVRERMLVGNLRGEHLRTANTYFFFFVFYWGGGIEWWWYWWYNKSLIVRMKQSTFSDRGVERVSRITAVMQPGKLTANNLKITWICKGKSSEPKLHYCVPCWFFLGCIQEHFPWRLFFWIHCLRLRVLSTKRYYCWWCGTILHQFSLVVVPWVVPPPSNSGKWRFRLGSPTKNMIILVVTGILGRGTTQAVPTICRVSLVPHILSVGRIPDSQVFWGVSWA